MKSTRTTAAVAGAFFILAAAAAVVGLALYGSLLHDARYVIDGSADTQVRLGALMEVIVVIAVVGTAVTLYPIVRRQNEGVAIAYVAGRVIEAVIIAVGIISLLSVLTLRSSFAGATGAQADAAVVVARALVAVHDWTFLVGPSLAIGVNTVLLAYLMLRSKLVPRLIPMIGLVGGPLIFASGVAELLGLYQQVSVWGGIAAIPVTAWEMSLAVWLILRGFKPSPILAGVSATSPPPSPARPGSSRGAALHG